MALSLDDRLLGEKVHNYCSSSSSGSEDERDDNEDGREEVGGQQKMARGKLQVTQPGQQPQQPPRDWSGAAANTGPKGVVADWRRFKQLEAESRASQEAERLALAARLSTACRSAAEDEQAAGLDAELEEALALVDDDAEFLARYRRQRLEAMRLALAQRKLFGRVVGLDRGSFVAAVDSEPADVTVLVHIGDAAKEPACAAVDVALDWLAGRYPTVKFCRIAAAHALVSRQFVQRGLPALVVYRAGEVTNSLVGLARDLGDACTPEELEAYLTEFGILSESLHCDGQAVQQLSNRGGTASSNGGGGGVGGVIRGPAAAATNSDSDSD